MAEDVKQDAADADADASPTREMEMVPNPLRLDPKRFEYDSMDVVLSSKGWIWLRLTPMVIPVGVKVSVVFPDRTRMDFEG